MPRRPERGRISTPADEAPTRAQTGILIDVERAEPLHNARSVIRPNPTSTRRITAQVQCNTFAGVLAGSVAWRLPQAFGACGVSLVASTLLCMARRADELHDRVVVVNPEEDCSPAAFRLLIDELSIEPEPELESLDAAAVLETIRAESEHA